MSARYDVSVFDPDSPVYLDKVVARVRAAGRMSGTQLCEAFTPYEPELIFAMGVLWSSDRVAWAVPPNERSTRAWMESVFMLGPVEARAVIAAEHELAVHGSRADLRTCPRAGEFGHYGCGVCEHGYLYGSCMPCTMKRLAERGEL